MDLLIWRRLRRGDCRVLIAMFLHPSFSLSAVAFVLIPFPLHAYIDIGLQSLLSRREVVLRLFMLRIRYYDDELEGCAIGREGGDVVQLG